MLGGGQQRTVPMPTSQSFSTEQELLKSKRLPMQEAQRSSYAGMTTTTSGADEDFVDVNAVSETYTVGGGDALEHEPETPNPERRARMSNILNPRAPVILTSKPAFSNLYKKRNESESG